MFSTTNDRFHCSLILLSKVRHFGGGAENAELDIAEPDNAAPYSKGGHHELDNTAPYSRDGHRGT